MAITKASSSAVAPAAKGDLVVGSATNDAAVLAVGANDTTLVADSTTATGLKWATPSSSAPSWSLISDTRVLSGTGATFTISSLGTYNRLYIAISECTPGTTGAGYRLRFNGVTTSSYYMMRLQLRNDSTYSTSVINAQGNYNAPTTSIELGTTSNGAGLNGVINIDNMLSANPKLLNYSIGSLPYSGAYANVGGGYFSGAAITSVSLGWDTGVYSDSRIIVYGSTQ